LSRINLPEISTIVKSKFSIEKSSKYKLKIPELGFGNISKTNGLKSSVDLFVRFTLSI